MKKKCLCSVFFLVSCLVTLSPASFTGHYRQALLAAPLPWADVRRGSGTAAVWRPAPQVTFLWLPCAQQSLVCGARGASGHPLLHCFSPECLDGPSLPWRLCSISASQDVFLFINFPCAGGPISSTDLFVPQFVFRYCFCPIDSGFCSGTLIIQMLDVRSPPLIPRVLSLLLRVKSLLHFASSHSGGLCGMSLMSQSERPDGPLVASLAPKPDTLPYHTEPPLPLCLSLTSSLHLCFLGASSISSFQ